tara:strand:- start:133 stop:402 length:270 start_codon:yes stop_codon:yes gene_type:complete
VLAAVLLAAPCVTSAAVDQGDTVPCDGVLISAKRAREAIACKREVELRKTFECDPCPACPEPAPDRTVQIASASFVTGLVFGLLLFFSR